MSDSLNLSSPRRRLKLGAAALALLAIGGGAGAFAGHAFHPPIAMAPVHAVAIKSLAEDDGIVTVKGRVAERYGNQFVLDDGTGKTLIDAGRAGEDATVAPTGSIVTIQGRFDHGALRPSFLVDPLGKVIALGHGGRGDHGGHGRHDHGPRGFDDGEGAGDGAGHAPPTASAAPAAAPAAPDQP